MLSGGGDRRQWIVFAEGSTTGVGRSSGSLIGGGGNGGLWSAASSNVGLAVAVTAMAGIALAATVIYSRGNLKSPWSRRRKKQALLPKQWKSFFTPEGKLTDGGVKFLKKVRSGGVDPSIRLEVWPFLLGVYDVNSSKEERESVKTQKRKEYEDLRRICPEFSTQSEKNLKLKKTLGNSSNESSGDFSQIVDSTPSEKSLKLKKTSGNSSNECSGDFSQIVDSSGPGDATSPGGPVSTEAGKRVLEDTKYDASHQAVLTSEAGKGDGAKTGLTCEDASAGDSESTDSDSSEDTDITRPLLTTEGAKENNYDEKSTDNSSDKTENKCKSHTAEDYATWQRIIRLDAVRANDEWITYSPTQAAVSEIKAHRLAESVRMRDYETLEPCRIFHAARLVAILEAYALYDPEIGYCQGMSDLLTPIISVMEEDDEAFWCFVGFMRKARHNFRLDEAGIRRQLDIVSKIIKGKDVTLYRHLEKLQAEDCFFVYRMVVVLFRRELTFEQTLCLWEVIWADQAAIRAGIAKNAWGRMRLRAPPTDDLLLYAIAACVLQRRKTIVEKYNCMEDIMRECNSMAGCLDVWKLLDDAHDLVVSLHDKI